MHDPVPDTTGVRAFIPSRDVEFEADDNDGERVRVNLTADVIYLVPYSVLASHAAELEAGGHGRCLRQTTVEDGQDHAG